MTRYTVIFWSQAQEALAQLRLEAADRRRMGDAADELDRLLAVDASDVGLEAHKGLRTLTVEPLLVQFSVEEADRTVKVWSVRRSHSHS